MEPINLPFYGDSKNILAKRSVLLWKKSTQHPVQKTTISRASCCHYQHFQVKHQASFLLEKQALVWGIGVQSKDISFHFQVFRLWRMPLWKHRGNKHFYPVFEGLYCRFIGFRIKKLLTFYLP